MRQRSDAKNSIYLHHFLKRVKKKKKQEFQTKDTTRTTDVNVPLEINYFPTPRFFTYLGTCAKNFFPTHFVRVVHIITSNLREQRTRRIIKKNLQMNHIYAVRYIK